MPTPPPLPPRSKPPQPASPSPVLSPPDRDDGYLVPSSIGLGYSGKLHPSDPRTSSSQSLIAPAVEADSRRSLLVIYIHGFYGNTQSFRSFPAHVHALLTELLSETHIVHSKIYPRYKCYRAIQVARDNFSAWLEPHESPTTDVILIGHSMGGLLSAEVALMPNRDPHLRQPFKHRILGTLSLDSPFLGLHPGIVVSGLSSLFQPAPKTDKDVLSTASQSSFSVDASASDLQLPLSGTPSIASSTSSPAPSLLRDPTYDPPYFNDLPFREKPLFARLRNFASKHKAEGIFNAIGNHIVSHMEFGGAMADYPELSARYKKLRALEDVDELRAIAEGHPPEAYRRVRFLNYYTLSTGRPKPPQEDDGETVAGSSFRSPSLDASRMEDGIPDIIEHSSTLPLPGAIPPEKAEKVASDEQAAADDTHVMKGELNTAVAELRSAASAKDPLHESLGKDSYDSDDMNRISMQILEPEPMTEEEHKEEEAETEIAMKEGKEVAPAGELATTENVTAEKEAAEELEAEQQDVEIQQATIPDVPPVSASPDAEPPLDFDLPPIPPEPAEPILPDLNKYTDKDARKQAEKESKRMQKAHAQALKDRAKAIHEREKLLEKRRKKSAKEAQRLEKQAHKAKGELAKAEREELIKVHEQEIMQALKDTDAADRAAAALGDGEEEEPPTPVDEYTYDAREQQHRQQAEKPRKLKKFCTLPSKVDGVLDPTWVDVYMADVDEVGAHCGLFAPGEHYDRLVGDVGTRIVGWVHDDMSMRAALAM